MYLIEAVKKTLEKATGYGRPKRGELASLVKAREPKLLRLKGSDDAPNNPALAVVIYPGAVKLDKKLDPAAIFEELFASNGWRDSWRYGIYDFAHYHSKTHEVLGIARGKARVELGGKDGRKVEIHAGDIVVLPAGTSHRHLSASDDLLVVGAYPATGSYDECRPSDGHEEALERVRKVPLPRKDPAYGKDGPLLELWKSERINKPTRPKKRRIQAD